LSFSSEKIIENVKKIYDTVAKSRPSSVKGSYFKKMSISSTLSPGVVLDFNSIG